MGRVASRLTKPVRTFNIESRASKVIENQAVKPRAAPKHPTTEEAISQFQQEHPEYLEAQQVRHEALHKNLKKIYVDTKDAPIEIKSAAKPLPTSRAAVQDTDLGSMDIDYDIPDGKAYLRTVLGFIGQHQLDPSNVTASVIANEHKLDKEEVESVLKHFKAFQLHIPENTYKENPKLKQIMSEQMNAATGSIPHFRISTSEAQKQLKDGTDTESPIKT